MSQPAKGAQAITLAERRAEAPGADLAMKRHVISCPTCRGRNRCGKWQDMATELRTIRAEIRSWFDPAPGQESLF